MSIVGKNNLSSQTKQPSESIIYNFDFANLLNVGETIDTIISVIATSNNRVNGSSLITLAGPATTNNINIVQQRLSGGTHNEEYIITVIVTTSTGNTREMEGLIFVQDQGLIV